MGRLAVILGSNALGPGGEEIAAAAAEHGAAIVQRHGDADLPYVLPHEIDHAANLRPLLEQGCDRVLAIGSVGSLSRELPVGSLLCPDDFIALHVGPSIFADARAHTRPRLRSALARRSARGLGRRRAGAARRRRLLAGARAALRDPGRDPADRPPRRRGRDDDRLRVHRRRRARARIRGALRRRQPRQRDRRGRARRRRARGRPRSPTPPACATGSPRCCRSWARSGGDAGGRPAPCSTASTVGVRCEEGRIAAIGPEVVAAARRRDDRSRGRTAGRAAAQRPHPRGDDAVPRQRRRPAADALAAGEDLAGRGEARRRGRLLGRAAGLRRDDPHRHHPLLGHVLAPGGDRAGGRRRGHPRRRSARRCSTTTATRWGCASAALHSLEHLAEPGTGGRTGARPALDLHGQRGLAALDRRAQRRARAADPDPPLRDRAGGRGLPRRARPAPRRLPRPRRHAGRAHRARPRRLARRRGAGADRANAAAPSSPTRSRT